jgi:surface polysaccharide O-acyltransferase-like enzyme
MVELNPELLTGAKEAGIWISSIVVVGCTTMAVLTASKGVARNTKTFYAACGFGIISISAIIMVLWFSTREVYQWVDTKNIADWGGGDVG